MKAARNLVLLAVALVLAFAKTSSAQAIKFVPDGAFVVIKFSNLEATSKKLADLSTALGLTQMQPAMSDPLGAVTAQLGTTEGINKSGELAVAVLDPEPLGLTWDNGKSVLLLLPVSDYKAFLGNFPNAKTDGDISEVHFKDDPDVTYVAHWGDYAAASPVRQLVATAPTTTLTVSGLAGKELSAKDAVVLVNIKAIRTKVLPKLEDARTQGAAAIDQAAQQPHNVGQINISKLAPLGKVVMNEAIDMAKEYLSDADFATFGANVSTDGIAVTAETEFQPDSKLGKYTAQVKNTDASLLTGLPDAKYLLMGGSIADPNLETATLDELINPIQTAIGNLGPDYAPAVDWIEQLKSTIKSSTGGTYGMLAPSGMLGQGAIIQAIAIRKGDSKASIEASRKMFDDQQALMKLFGLQTQASVQTYTPDGKTLDGVNFDVLVNKISIPGGNMQAQQAQMMVNMIYGPEGMKMYTGAINDQTLMIAMDLDDPMLSTAIAAAKSGDDPIAKTGPIKAIASQLPANRLAVVYLPLDVWANTGLNYARQFSMDMGIKLPDDLPPVGITLATEGTAIRMDGYIPAQLVQAITSAGLQLYMGMNQHQAPAPGQNGGGGGL